jgi:hypothetical protein
MTLAQIKQLFPVGQRVNVTRDGDKPLIVVGNLGNTVLPANNGAGERTITAVKSTEWVMLRPDGRSVHTDYPKASEVMEARVGLVKFKYDNGTIITIEAL